MCYKRRRPIRKVILVAILLLAAVAFILDKLLPRPRIYPGFGVFIPAQYAIVGIDVSRYQGRIFWESVAAMKDQDRHIDFAFIKATEGETGIDSRFDYNWKAAGEALVPRGAYHYFHPAQNASLQARNFLQQTTGTTGNLRPVLDVETLENVASKALRDSICTWLTAVGNSFETAPIIYTNASFYNQYLKGYFDDYPLWIAHYKATKPAVRTDVQFWQFSDSGRVNGVTVPVDFNVFTGDRTALQELLLKEH